MPLSDNPALAAVRPPPRGQLLRVLGITFGLAVTIGNTIGAGILRTPGDVAANLPNPWLFIAVWIVGGLYALLGAVSLAELGTIIPRSGGQYVFARRALGDYAGFIVGWSDWLSTCGTTAAVSLVVGEYLGVLFPALGGRSVSIALSVTVLFAALQWRGIEWGSRVQNVTSLLKALAFVALVVACFALGGKTTATSNVSRIITPTGLLFMLALIKALQAVVYTYDGWEGVLYFSEEVREPARDIPRSLIGGVLSIIGIYLLVNLALLYVLPVASLAGKELAVGAAAQVVFGGYGDAVIRALTIVSLLSGINAYHLIASRVLYAMSRDGLFSQRVVKVNQGGTPTAALFVSTAVALLFIIGSRTFAKIIDALAFFFVANYTMSFISVFVLRRREPDAPRPYRAWGYPYTTLLTLVISILFLIGAIAGDIASGTQGSVNALIMLALSYPVFLLLRRLSGSDVPAE